MRPRKGRRLARCRRGPWWSRRREAGEWDAVPHSDLYLLYFAGPNEGREWTAESEWDRNMDRKRWSSHGALLYYT